MKVDTEEFTGPWTESLSIRIQLPLPSPNSDDYTIDKGFVAAEQHRSAPSHTAGFARSSAASLMALRSLPPPAQLVLFTPVIAPTSALARDPFETFGRELARHHPNISHVPYVGSAGFTKFHLDFVMHSAAVITIIWESDRALQEELTEQEEFAEAAFEAFTAKDHKEIDSAKYVLVQYPAGGADSRVPFECPNIIEAKSYDRDAACLANAIFGRTS